MIVTCSDLHHRAAHRHVASGRWKLIVADVISIAVPELSSRSFPPAPDRSGLEQCARVIPTRSDLANRSANADVASGRRELVVSDPLGAPVSEPAESAAPPASDRPGQKQCARLGSVPYPA